MAGSISSSSSWNNSNSSNRQIDTTSGQNAAKQMGDALAQAEYEKSQQLLKDPMSVVASIARIRKMQEYMNAYKGGYNLPDQEVIQQRRIGGETYSNNNSNSSSFSSSRSLGKQN
jgi:hypothetical protein